LIIVDTGIWVNHIKEPNPKLVSVAEGLEALLHPYVLGELALGSLPRRAWFLGRLAALPQPPVARPADLLQLIDSQKLFSTGIGYVDAHLLASARLIPGAKLWTRDKRLHAQAERLGVSFAA